MTLVDELLVFLACSVILIEGEPVVRVVSPAEVAVEFLYRHELHGVHTEVLDVVELRHGSFYVLRLGEVAEKHLVDHKVMLVLDPEVRMLPAV